MSISRHAKLAIATIRYLSSKILTGRKNTVCQAKHQLKQQLDCSLDSPPSTSYNNISSVVSYSSWYSSIHSKLNSFHAFGNQNHRPRPIFNGARRFYHRVVHYHADDRNLIQRAPRNISITPRNILVNVLVNSGVGINKWGLERIPYSRRIHFIHLSRYLERKIGEIIFNDVKKTYGRRRILPETHPKSVRVKSIAEDIIEALRKGLGYEQVGMI